MIEKKSHIVPFSQAEMSYDTDGGSLTYKRENCDDLLIRTLGNIGSI